MGLLYYEKIVLSTDIIINESITINVDRQTLLLLTNVR